jgi:hypothetical protein
LAFDPVYRTGPALARGDLAAFDTSIARTMTGFTVEERALCRHVGATPREPFANKLIDPTSSGVSLTIRLKAGNAYRVTEGAQASLPAPSAALK